MRAGRVAKLEVKHAVSASERPEDQIIPEKLKMLRRKVKHVVSQDHGSVVNVAELLHPDYTHFRLEDNVVGILTRNETNGREISIYQYTLYKTQVAGAVSWPLTTQDRCHQTQASHTLCSASHCCPQAAAALRPTRSTSPRRPRKDSTDAPAWAPLRMHRATGA